MKSVFHEGEREVQERAGVTRMANRLANAIHSSIPEAVQDFLQEQPIAVVASADAQGAVWSSLVWGEPGFMQAIDARTVWIDADPVPGDPLARNLHTPEAMHEGIDVGLMAVELETRSRIRVNGKAKLRAEGGFELHVEQAYGNCPKYIQTRLLTSDSRAHARASITQHEAQLSAAQQAWIARSDTVFIASIHKEGGADSSHRGGLPGFIHVLDERSLAFPDYAGNNMFNTLGNLAVNPNAGLLFVDFETGATLQLTGKAQILWEAAPVARFPGAQRAVHFDIESVLQTDNAVPLRWTLEQYSPFNPR